ncbi:CBS domain-containing protein [Desulfohalotomaculum tongense]|uniref:CBS domain-containing protein n=1 Tax=Desulforadius tongensis TaxID=1216062 RepID=UPI00195B3B7B|nr:CBS domain-containing protein [Desulforadius tongensis]MBM7853990.1 CBS domain-containing protein [Desulforadius tongensis]
MPVLAGDIMMPADNCTVIYEDETVQRALLKIQFMLCSGKGKCRVLLVLNAEDKPVGWVALTDILAVMERSINNKGFMMLSNLTGPSAYIARQMMNWFPDDIYRYAEHRLENSVDIKMKSLMRSWQVVFVSPDAALSTLVSVMSKNSLTILPVVKNEHLVGFVFEEDIVVELARLVLGFHGRKEKLLLSPAHIT